MHTGSLESASHVKIYATSRRGMDGLVLVWHLCFAFRLQTTNPKLCLKTILTNRICPGCCTCITSSTFWSYYFRACLENEGKHGHRGINGQWEITYVKFSTPTIDRTTGLVSVTGTCDQKQEETKEQQCAVYLNNAINVTEGTSWASLAGRDILKFWCALHNLRVHLGTMVHRE